MDKKCLQKIVDSLDENGIFNVLIEQEQPTIVSKKHTEPILEDIDGILEIVGYKEIPYYEKAVKLITIVNEFINYNDDTW